MKKCEICNGKGYVLVPGHPKTFCLCSKADDAWAQFLLDGGHGDFEFPMALNPNNGNEAVFRQPKPR